jgi:hypothetical protein
MAKSDILSWRLQPPAISTIRPIIAFEGARALYLGPALGLKREIGNNDPAWFSGPQQPSPHHVPASLATRGEVNLHEQREVASLTHVGVRRLPAHNNDPA